MCEAIGLMPTDTGKPGGKRVGDSVQTYIIDGGLFDLASATLVDSEFRLSWVDRFPPQLPDEPEATDTPNPAGGPAPAHAQSAESSSPNPLDQLDALDREEEEGAEHSALLDVGGDGDLPSTPKPVNAFKPVDEPEPKVQDDAPPMKVFAHARTEELAQLGIEPKKATKNPSKSKYSCPVKTCKGNVWGKPGMRISCMGTDKKPHDAELMAFDGAASQEDANEKIEAF
ncbi:hypothetical protein D3C77_523970 [compost metagenome]